VCMVNEETRYIQENSAGHTLGLYCTLPNCKLKQQKLILGAESEICMRHVSVR
jgi:hypothetical protein